MGDLAQDTAVEGGGGRYRARLSEEWRIWGPNGGYLSLIALRAAAAATPFTRPASFHAHFLNLARFDAVEIDVVPLRISRRTAAMRFTMHQGERVILNGSCWLTDGGLGGLEHDDAPMPEMPAPESVPTDQERFGDEWPWFPFWRNLEVRNPSRVSREERRTGRPLWRSWFRLRPRARFEDPLLNAGRALVILDTMTWPSAAQAHHEPAFIAPNLDLAVVFHRGGPESEYLLGEGTAPVAESGLIGCQGRVWDRQGRLLASSVAQLLCRPR